MEQIESPALLKERGAFLSCPIPNFQFRVSHQRNGTRHSSIAGFKSCRSITARSN
jgi:hypothetical protein